ncbi:site-specific integrase, partial [Vibrio sp. 10N.261.49.A5]
MAINGQKSSGYRDIKSKSDKRLSKANYEFDVYSDNWQLDANVRLNLALLEPLSLTPKFSACFRLALADYAAEFSSNYARNIFSYTRLLFEMGVTDKITEQYVINFKSSLTQNTEYKLGYIRAFLLDWHDKEIY